MPRVDNRHRPDRRLDEDYRSKARERDRARYAKIKDDPAYKERIRLQSIKKRLDHPEKQAARIAVRTAIVRGDLVREPCAKCGHPDTQGHHEDYSKALDVVWLCRPHHEERHRELRLIERQQRTDCANDR